MLIIAMPKSASTSLTNTLGEISRRNTMLGIPAINIDIDCEGFKEVQKYHCNMIERSPLFIKQIINGQKKIFKEHLLPTSRHLKILAKFKKPILILLRDVDDCYDAYCRHDRAHFHKTKRHMDLKQVKKDLSEFHNKYMWWASNKKHVLVVYFKDLVFEYNKTMKKIMKHFKLGGKIIPLRKDKFTGYGVEALKKKEVEKIESVEVIEEKEVQDVQKEEKKEEIKNDIDSSTEVS